MPRFDNLGPALRYLRLHGGPVPRKQLEVAARADVTRGMLSSYEKGRRDPTLRTLERLLRALDADLVQLDWALRMVGTGAGEPPPAPPRWRGADEVAEPPAVYRTVNVPEPLSPREENALGQMIAGFLSYLRYTRHGDEEPGEDGPERAVPEARDDPPASDVTPRP